MKFPLFLLLTVLFLIAPLHADPMRQTLNFNRDWRFQPGDPAGAQAPDYDAASWSAVNLPHSFSMPYFGAPNFYTGYGWYRKTFVLPANWQVQRWYLEFEGVFQDAEVWLNGQRIGRHRGGYTGFELDVTLAARSGENVLAVRVNNLWDAQLAPRAGEHVFSGGIYRDVFLSAKSPLHITWYGTSVTTPVVSHERATVQVETELRNLYDTPSLALVRHNIFDAKGRRVATWEDARRLAAGETVTFSQTSPDILRPRLWHPNHPELYTVTTQVFKDKTLTDETSSPLGFRWFKWTADQGFFLNGEHLYLYGANVHQDHAGWGDAVTNAGFERDVKQMKDAGFNFIRGSHYPHDPAFSAACDRLGMLLWSENAFWGIGGFGPDGYWNSSAYPPGKVDAPEFEASVKEQLREMVRIHRNHPSIVAWSMGNETFFSEKAVMPKMKAFLAELVSLTHELDPTRPAAIGGVQRPLDEGRIDRVGDIAGYNGDGASLREFQNPGVPNIVAEYGSTTAVRPGKYQPGWDHLAKDGGKPVHPWRSGQIIWCGFDHGSIAGDNLGRMGIVDYFRIPKRAWYWYRNEYRHIPPPEWPVEGAPAKLRLEADKTVLKSVDGTDDSLVQVTVLDAAGRELSNNVPVTLEIVSGPGEFPTGPSITFEPKSDIAILDGKAAIEFRSYYAGTTVIRASSPGLAAAEITITSQGEPAWVEGVTPRVAARPYVRWTQRSRATASQPARNLATDRPTKASSVATGSSSANVTDGKTTTLWRAEENDISPWIRLDLENTYALNRVQLVFPEAGRYAYTAAVSSDGTVWHTIVDASQGQSGDKVRTATGNFGKGIRFLRVSFSGWPPGQGAALAEIEVGGGTE